MYRNPLKKATSRSKTGVPGVYLSGGRKVGDTYQARISVDKKEIYLGASRDLAKVVALRKEAEAKYYGIVT